MINDASVCIINGRVGSGRLSRSGWLKEDLTSSNARWCLDSQRQACFLLLQRVRPWEEQPSLQSAACNRVTIRKFPKICTAHDDFPGDGHLQWPGRVQAEPNYLQAQSHDPGQRLHWFCEDLVRDKWVKMSWCVFETKSHYFTLVVTPIWSCKCSEGFALQSEQNCQ